MNDDLKGDESARDVDPNVVPEDPDPTKEPDLQGVAIPDSVLNLLPVLKGYARTDKRFEDLLKAFPRQILDDKDEGERGRKGWIDKVRERMRLWLGDLDEKAFPFENCANVHDPVMFSRLTRLVARAYGEIFAPNQPIFSALASSHLSEEKAAAITRHQNAQFRKTIPDFPRHVLRGLHAFFRDGEAVWHSYRDKENNVNRHDYLQSDRFIYPYTVESTATDMSDVPWKIKILYKYGRQLRRMARLGYYDKDAVAKVVAKKPSAEDGVERPVQEKSDEHHGISREECTRDVPYTLYEYYGWLTIPDKDEDIPVRAVLDVASEQLLAIYSRYYNDPTDQGRFDRQTAEFEAYQQELELFAQAMQKEAELAGRLELGDIPPDESVEIAQAVQRQRPLEPVKPDWMDERGSAPVPCRKKVIEPFVHAVCIENPDGSYGIGVGTMLEPHQKTMNALLDAIIDQATLANGRVIFKHKNLKLPPGITTIEPGKIIEVTGPLPADGIEKAMHALDVPPANPQLFTVVENQRNAADSVSSAPDVLSGERASGEPFRGQAGRVEQATKQLSMFSANILLALGQIGRNNMQLDSQFAPDDEMLDLPDPNTGKLVPTRIRRDFYNEEPTITFTADLTFKSAAARVAEADDALGMLTKGMPAALQPMMVLPIVECVRNCLKVRGMYGVLALMPTNDEVMARMAPPPPAPGPLGAPPRGSQPPAPSVPTGTPNGAPGTRPPQTQLPPAVAPQGAPLRTA